MGIGKIAKDIVSGLVSPVSNVFVKREERKQAVESAKVKAAAAKASGDKEITLTDSEWEHASVEANQNSWKDEYLTIIITSPIVGLLAGGVWFAFTGDARLLNGVNEGIKALRDTGVDMGDLMYAVVLAGVGLKLWRAK